MGLTLRQGGYIIWNYTAYYEGLGGGSGIHYSLKN